MSGAVTSADHSAVSKKARTLPLANSNLLWETDINQTIMLKETVLRMQGHEERDTGLERILWGGSDS